jgi:hypothetical protein
MTTEQKIIKTKVGALETARQLGSGSQVQEHRMRLKAVEAKTAQEARC